MKRYLQNRYTVGVEINPGSGVYVCLRVCVSECSMYAYVYM